MLAKTVWSFVNHNTIQMINGMCLKILWFFNKYLGIKQRVGVKACHVLPGTVSQVCPYSVICKFVYFDKEDRIFWGLEEIEKVEEPIEQLEHVYQREATKASTVKVKRAVRLNPLKTVQYASCPELSNRKPKFGIIKDQTLASNEQKNIFSWNDKVEEITGKNLPHFLNSVIFYCNNLKP